LEEGGSGMIPTGHGTSKQPGSDKVALILKDTMEEAGGALLKVVPVEAEVVVADSWAEK
jgi:hypothetical protein